MRAQSKTFKLGLLAPAVRKGMTGARAPVTFAAFLEKIRDVHMLNAYI